MREIHDREAVILDVAVAARSLDGANDIDLAQPLQDDVFQVMPEAEWRHQAKKAEVRQKDALPL